MATVVTPARARRPDRGCPARRPTPPARASLDGLIATFRADTAAYFAGRGGDNSAALELFRRAVLERDEDAWQAIYDAYLPLVTAWVARHPSLAHAAEEPSYLANRAFERFWRAVRPDRLANFPTLPSLLRYLKMCANCAVMDAARAYRPAEQQPLDQFDAPSQGWGNVERTEEVVCAEELWRKVATVIRDPVGEHLAWDTLVLGMTPRQVLATHPDGWGSIDEIYEAKAALLRRLRASPELAGLRPAQRTAAARRAS